MFMVNCFLEYGRQEYCGIVITVDVFTLYDKRMDRNIEHPCVVIDLRTSLKLRSLSLTVITLTHYVDCRSQLCRKKKPTPNRYTQ